MINLKEHYKEIEKLGSADDIRSYIFKNARAVCDEASLFVVFAYISEPSENKNELRRSAYLAFFANDKEKFKRAWECIDILNNSQKNCGLKVRILKGGAYKIKDYYLENNDLNDIRGASILLTHIERNVVPDMISAEFIPECIVYNGGGNVFAVLPENTAPDFAERLEQTADDMLITANVAYCLSSPMDAADILGSGYRGRMAGIENILDERKKLKIYNNIENSGCKIPEGFNIPFGDGEELNVEFNGSIILDEDSREYCSACGKRFAGFLLDKAPLCKGCLIKRKTGKAAEHGVYIKEFKKRTEKLRDFEPKRIYSAEDISDDRIAVVYADGNNMGGIIQRFTKITQMMEFSRNVKEVTQTGVYGALCENKVDAFEIVALGGDDVFVIVPAEKSFDFSVSFAKKYKEHFAKLGYQDTSTMSVGIAAAKNNTPVRIILDAAEDKLDSAKIFERNRAEKERDGSIAFVILNSYDAKNDKTQNNIAAGTMQPYSIKSAEDISKWLDGSNSAASKSRIRNILDAFRSAESLAEAKLFFNYLNAKGSGNKNRGKLPEISGCKQDSGFYVLNNGRYCYIWDDLLDLEKLCERGNYEEKI